MAGSVLTCANVGCPATGHPYVHISNRLQSNGKGKDGANTLGPMRVSPDELESSCSKEGFALSMTAYVNDELVCSGQRTRSTGTGHRITSTVTTITPDELFEWRHPVGHRWRWEFKALAPTRAQLAETFDFRNTGPIKDKVKYYQRMCFVKSNAAGIEATLSKLRDRYNG